MSNVEVMYSVYFKKTERSENILHDSAVRCSNYVYFHTSTAASLKSGQSDRKKN